MTVSTTTPQPSKLSTLEVFLNFIKHPGTNTALGLTFAALAQFTASVPAGDRNTTTWIGVGYAVANLILSRFDDNPSTLTTK
jgi:hypothetical protein